MTDLEENFYQEQKKETHERPMRTAINQFRINKWKQYCSLLWRKDPSQIDKIEYMPMNELKNKIEELSSTNPRKKYKNYFITITSTPETDKLKFINGCKKLLDNAVIDRGYMVFEQRGETMETVGKGLHCHLLLIREKYTHSKFSRRLLEQLIKLEINETYKSYKQLLKLANLNSSPFSFQNIKDETVPKKLNYIQGNKNDEKLTKVEFDKVFRKTFDLQVIYKKNI